MSSANGGSGSVKSQLARFCDGPQVDAILRRCREKRRRGAGAPIPALSITDRIKEILRQFQS
jgi:hypothetical protein